MTIYQILEQSARNHPDKPAVVFGDQRLSYQDLLAGADRLGAAFSDLGLAKGDRIATFSPNCPEVVCTYFAAMKLGLVYVGLNVMLKPAELDYILADCSPRAILVAGAAAELLEEVEFVRTTSVRIIMVDVPGVAPEEYLTVRELIAAASDHAARSAPRRQDVAMIGYTSGTTGFPKGAAHTHNSILAALEGVSKQLACRDNDVFLAALPLFQLSAFLFNVGLSILAGATLVLMDKFAPGAFVEKVEKERVTIFCAVPTILQMLLDESKTHEFDFSSVRVVPTAGAMLSLTLRQELEKRLSCRIVHGYGSTETGLFIALEDLDRAAKGVSVGSVLPGVKVRLARDDGSCVAVGERGEILVAGDRLFSCYWNNPEATQEAVRDGWYATGDIGRFDPEGHLYIEDRKRDMIIRGGFNIYPAELERILSRDPRIKEIIVIGVPHRRLGEVPKAYVVLEQGQSLTAQELIALSREQLASYKALEYVEIVAEDFLPRNALGKVLKRELRAVASPKRCSS